MEKDKEHKIKGKSPKLLAYRGVTCGNFLWIRGRIVQNNDLPAPSENDSLWKNMSNSFKRVTCRGYPNEKGMLSISGQNFEFTCDKHGSFELYTNKFQPQSNLFRLDASWTFPDLNYQIETPETIYNIQPQSPGQPFGIISDIDDTVVHTFVQYKSQAVLRTMMGNAYTKDAIAGAATFLNRLSREGLEEDNRFPVFYVSRSPYQIYDVLNDFFHLNNFPDGPIWLKYAWLKSLSYKQQNVVKEPKYRNMCRLLEMTSPLPYIVIGDSAELDAIIYLNLAKKFPNRILRIYIRRVTTSEEFEVLRRKTEAFKDKDLVLFFKYYHELNSDAKKRGFL